MHQVFTEQQLLDKGVPFLVLDGQFYLHLSVFADGRPSQSFNWPIKVASREDGPTVEELKEAAKIAVYLAKQGSNGLKLEFVEGLHFHEGQDVVLINGKLVSRSPAPYLVNGLTISKYPVPSILSIQLKDSKVTFKDIELTTSSVELDLSIKGSYLCVLWPNKHPEYKQVEFEIENNT